MNHSIATAIAGSCLSLSVATQLSAQTVLSGDHSIDGRLCVGYACTGSETFQPIDAMKIRSSVVGLSFEDTSNSSFPNRDWRLLVNDGGSLASGAIDRFSIQDLDAGTTPFTIEGEAPNNAIYVGDEGRVGLGTSMPGTDLHIISSWLHGARIRFEDTWGDTYSWDLAATDQSFFLYDRGSPPSVPFRIEAGSPDHAFHMATNGYLGLGTDTPEAPLELYRPDSFNFFRITAAGAAINRSVDVTFTQGPLGTGELRYNIVDGDGPEMKLNADGDIEIAGTLTTGGPTCDSGCDAVFDAGFERLSVTDHAALMWENGHLPAVGPTLPNAPMNVSEKMGGILNELEHAHIYIEDLNARLAAQEALNARLIARLDALEAAD